jgi:hypothetical protein
MLAGFRELEPVRRDFRFSQGSADPASQSPVSANPIPDRAWSPAARLLASLLIVAYLAAVIVPPLAGPPPASRLAEFLLQPLRPLVGALYLGHGYRFFAPDPGPGHTIRWSMQMADGSSKSGTIPDREQDRPRLLYHRRFMVSEKIAALVPPADAPAEVRERARGDWLPLVKGVAGNLLRQHGGATIRLEMVEHYLPDTDEVIRGTQGPDAVVPLGTFARLGEPAP